MTETQYKVLHQQILNDSDLTTLFRSTDDYPTWESMVTSIVDWAFDNHEVEALRPEDSAKCEILYKLSEYCHADADLILEILDNKEFI